MQKFLKKVFKKSKKLFNLINIFDQNKGNFDLELYLYKALEERNITLKITNEDTLEEVINILLILLLLSKFLIIGIILVISPTLAP